MLLPDPMAEKYEFMWSAVGIVVLAFICFEIHGCSLRMDFENDFESFVSTLSLKYFCFVRLIALFKLFIAA